MKHIIRRSKIRHGRVKVYASVKSQSGGPDHTVVYIRSKNFRGCLCDCKNFLFDKMGKNRNCEHEKYLRSLYGRYFAKVQ